MYARVCMCVFGLLPFPKYSEMMWKILSGVSSCWAVRILYRHYRLPAEVDLQKTGSSLNTCMYICMYVYVL